MPNWGGEGGGAKAGGRCGVGDRHLPGILPAPSGGAKLALSRNARRMAHHSVVHTTAWEASGDVSALLLRPGPDNPDPSEIDRVCKYVLVYGRTGVEQPKIQREIWRDAVLGYDERSDAKAICTKLLNTTAARRMITKAECMVEAGNPPPWGRSEKFAMVSLSGFRKL